jgi:oxygen-independent coproporphyrinogen-3 oxidase
MRAKAQKETAKNLFNSDELIKAARPIMEKYNRPAPRYTSYPTAPTWDSNFSHSDFQCAIDEGNERSKPLSLYFHIPFCNSLCLYCGCNTVINKNNAVSIPYLDHIKREIDWISGLVDPARTVAQMHWGGGTPTYLSADQIEDLFHYIKSRFSFASDSEIGIEIDPRATTEEQCLLLKQLGFNRLSLGLQDFDPLVVNRIQSFEMVKHLFDYCRELGFNSINVDLIYGLPHQSLESFSATIERVLEINPDRIALFSYAHVPWLKKQQNSFAKFLPPAEEKFKIFAHAIESFTAASYRYIGLDHFARPNDELCIAQDDRTLHRNFQGYTTKAGCDLHGLGVSSISSLSDIYAQNHHQLAGYYETIDNNRWPIIRGARLSREDRLRRAVINRILCHCLLVKSEIEREFQINFNEHFANELESLRELEGDGLARVDEDRIEVTSLGRIFIRNIAMVFDAYLQKSAPVMPIYSKTL